MVFFLVFILLVLASVIVRLVVLGVKLQWLMIINGTFVFIGLMVAMGLERLIGRLSMPVGLAVILVTAVAVWKSLELLRGYAEDHLGSGAFYLAIRVFEFIVVGAGPAAFAYVTLQDAAEIWAIPNELLVVFGAPPLLAGIAYYLYDLRFREKEAMRLWRRSLETNGMPMGVYTEGYQIKP